MPDLNLDNVRVTRAAHPCAAPTAADTPPRRSPGLQARDDLDPELVALVRAARGGSDLAWTRLVERFDGMLRRVARRYRLASTDIDDVVQATWLDFLQGVDRIREPAAIGGWLATVAGHNALRLCQLRRREQPTDDPGLGDRRDADEPEATVLAAERRNALNVAVRALPDRQRRLVTVLLTQPALDYRGVGELLSMPIGSIGPNRARALVRLAGDPQLGALAATERACITAAAA
ncbi:MAG: hypothetical protein QOD83_3063 [Solirubrobacteraceae bacterium]|nr:hypothetical protein [Solirubrobacteraceae bacterium]